MTRQKIFRRLSIHIHILINDPYPDSAQRNYYFGNAGRTASVLRSLFNSIPYSVYIHDSAREFFERLKIQRKEGKYFKGNISFDIVIHDININLDNGVGSEFTLKGKNGTYYTIIFKY